MKTLFKHEGHKEHEGSTVKGFPFVYFVPFVFNF